MVSLTKLIHIKKTKMHTTEIFIIIKRKFYTKYKKGVVTFPQHDNSSTL